MSTEETNNSGVIYNLVDTARDLVRDRRVSGRELDALTSMIKWYDDKYTLTDRQFSYMKNIVDKFSPDNQDFINNYTDDMRKRFKLACDYYRSTTYFADLVRKSDMDKTFIPSRRQYDRMCDNKYFNKALENYNSKPRYNIGDMICLRKRMSIYMHDASECVGIVAGVEETPSFRAGLRKYNIMWISGNYHTNNVSEMYIKLYRESKVAKDANTTEI